MRVPISLRSLENDAAAGVMRDMKPPEKKPYKIPNAMVPPRFVAANMRNSSPPDMTVHGIITLNGPMTSPKKFGIVRPNIEEAFMMGIA